MSKKAPRSNGKRRAGGRRNGRLPAQVQALSYRFQSRRQRRGQRRSTHPPFRAAVRCRAAARSARPVSSPSAAGSGSLVPARGHGGRAAGRARQGCVCGAGYPVRSFEQRNAPARSGGSDGPPARPSGSRAGSPPARLARRPAEPVNRRSSVGGPTREAARPTVRETRISGPLRAFLPAAARGRAFPGRGPGEDMEAFASKRASDPSGGPFPALCAAEGPLPRRGPLLPIRAQTRPVRRENGGRRVREAAKRLPPGAARREKTVRQTGSFQSPHRLCPRRYPRKAAPTGAKRPQPASGKRPSRAHNAPGQWLDAAPAGRGAALHRRLNAG